MIPNFPRTLFMFTNYHSLNLETKKKFGSAEAFATVSTFPSGLTSSKAVTASTVKPYYFFFHDEYQNKPPPKVNPLEATPIRVVRPPTTFTP
jgi:hypothetical protein